MTDILVVGNPIDGVDLYTVDGPDDPLIEQKFANETWWVAEAPRLDTTQQDRVLFSITVSDVEALAGRSLGAEELDRITRALGHSSISEAVPEVVFAVTGSPADDDDDE